MSSKWQIEVEEIRNDPIKWMRYGPKTEYFHVYDSTRKDRPRITVMSLDDAMDIAEKLNNSEAFSTTK